MEKGWDDSFWKLVGLEDLIDDNYSKIGKRRENSKSDHSCVSTKIFVIFLFELYYENSIYFFQDKVFQNMSAVMDKPYL